MSDSKFNRIQCYLLRTGSGCLLTDAKVFIPHGVQANCSLAELLLQVFKGNVEFELHPVSDAQLLAQAAQHQHPVLILLVTTPADQHQLHRLPTPRATLFTLQKFSKGPDLEPVVLLGPELSHGDHGVTLPLYVLLVLQRGAEEGLDVAGGVDHARAVRRPPQCQDVAQRPRGVDHDHVAAGPRQPVQQGKHAVVDDLHSTQQRVTGDIIRIVEAGNKYSKTRTALASCNAAIYTYTAYT